MNGDTSTEGEFGRSRCHILAFLCALCRLPIRSQGAAGVTALGSSLWKAQGLQQDTSSFLLLSWVGVGASDKIYQRNPAAQSQSA